MTFFQAPAWAGDITLTKPLSKVYTLEELVAKEAAAQLAGSPGAVSSTAVAPAAAAPKRKPGRPRKDSK